MISPEKTPMSSYFRGGHVSAAFLYRKPTFRFLLELDDCFGDLAKDSGSRLGSKGNLAGVCRKKVAIRRAM